MSSSLSPRKNNQYFDLNVEKILENWEVHHAIREIIANALDEQTLTNTRDIKIFKYITAWHIVDYGRGLSYHHLTQNENVEKLSHNRTIGRFGVGLKDALATLHRNGVYILIKSKHGIITLSESSKTGFDDVVTLHAKIESSPKPNMEGTDFLIYGCKDEDIIKAKNLFLQFTEEEILETTNYGQIILPREKPASIYINGVKVASEDNFLFSYNITSLTKQLKRALNRERTNVGRSAYTDRIKSILLSSNSEEVITKLITDIQHPNDLWHDELQWADVALYASRKIGLYKKNIVFVSPNTLRNGFLMNEIESQGYEPVIIPESLEERVNSQLKSTKGTFAPVHTTETFITELNQHLEYNFIAEKDLTLQENYIWSQLPYILELIGGKPQNVLDIKISETIYKSETTREVVGLWIEETGTIIIKRNQLNTLCSFAGTLLHECAHALSGQNDITHDFENTLTEIIGKIATKYIYKS